MRIRGIVAELVLLALAGDAFPKSQAVATGCDAQDAPYSVTVHFRSARRELSFLCKKSEVSFLGNEYRQYLMSRRRKQRVFRFPASVKKADGTWTTRTHIIRFFEVDAVVYTCNVQPKPGAKPQPHFTMQVHLRGGGFINAVVGKKLGCAFMEKFHRWLQGRARRTYYHQTNRVVGALTIKSGMYFDFRRVRSMSDVTGVCAKQS